MKKEVKGPLDMEKKPVLTRREALERMAKLGFVIASPLVMVNCGGSSSGGYSSAYSSALYMSAYHSEYSSHYASAVYTSSP